MAWWDGWIKPAINIGAAVVGGAVGSLAGPAGAAAGATLAYSLASGIQDSLQSQSDAQAQQGFAQQAATQAATQADLEKQQQAIAWEQSQRQLAAEASQRDIQVSQTNASAKKGAIDAFQTESAGQAAAAGSGAAPGSTPFAALEASTNENQRNLKDWWSNASASIGLSGMQGVSIEQNARFNWQVSNLQQASLLRQKSQYEWQASKYDEAASTPTLIANIAGSAISAVSSAYSMYSTVGVLDIMAKKAGDTGLSLGSVLRDAPQLKAAQVTGDYSYFQPAQTGPTIASRAVSQGGGMAENMFSIPNTPQMATSPLAPIAFMPDYNLAGSMASFKRATVSPLGILGGL